MSKSAALLRRSVMAVMADALNGIRVAARASSSFDSKMVEFAEFGFSSLEKWNFGTLPKDQANAEKAARAMRILADKEVIKTPLTSAIDTFADSLSAHAGTNYARAATKAFATMDILKS